jgi:hypothetical protein
MMGVIIRVEAAINGPHSVRRSNMNA